MDVVHIFYINYKALNNSEGPLKVLNYNIATSSIGNKLYLNLQNDTCRSKSDSLYMVVIYNIDCAKKY